MPTWSEILVEITKTLDSKGNPDFDKIRIKYLKSLSDYTRRNVILYGTKWTENDPNVGSNVISVNVADVQGLMEVVYGLKGEELDLIIHSPGGSAEAAEVMVNYLRQKFSHIRAFIPLAAMSAATMIACACDVIVMGKQSSLGPIDPQIVIPTQLGMRMVPAEAILEQFERAKRECQNPAKMGAWLPMLGQYGPDLIVQCENAKSMAKELVTSWLSQYMFKSDASSSNKAEKAANWLSEHKTFKSHRRHLSRERLSKEAGLRIEFLESDQRLQDAVLSVFHALSHTFNGTPAAKIIQNHNGRAFVHVLQQHPVVLAPPEQKP